MDNAERGDLGHFISGSSTLNNSPRNTPPQSRDSSPTRKEKADTHTPMDLSTAPFYASNGYLYNELDIKWMGVVLVGCFFTSGLVDAVAFSAWNCFVGMQTGNTVFAALGLGGQPRASHRQQYYKSLVAIASFCLGTLFFNLLHRWPTTLAKQPSSRRRMIFASSFLIQALFIIIAAVLVQIGKVSNRPYVAGTFSSGSHITQPGSNTPNFVDLVPIAILSFQAAGQICLSRVLGVIELPTIVLSTLYHDFVADLYTIRATWQQSAGAKDFFTTRFKRQEKRFFAIIALFIGALIGGEMYKSPVGMAGALWVAAALKLATSIAFMAWRKEQGAILPS